MNRNLGWFHFGMLTLVLVSFTVRINVLWAEDAGTTVVTDAELSQIKLQPQLKRLHLNESKITDAGLVHLKELTQTFFVGAELSRRLRANWLLLLLLI